MYATVIFIIMVTVTLKAFEIPTTAYSDSSSKQEINPDETLETDKEPESFFRAEYEIIDEITISENPPPMLETVHGTLPETAEKPSTQTESQSSSTDTAYNEDKNPASDTDDKITNKNEGNIFIYVFSIIFACIIFTTIPVLIIRKRKSN